MEEGGRASSPTCVGIGPAGMIRFPLNSVSFDVLYASNQIGRSCLWSSRPTAGYLGGGGRI
jgi:hypothetical protein